jgi:hypothetical protein
VDGTWNLDRRYLFPAQIQMMGQACAAAAILRVAKATSTQLATTTSAAAKATDLFPNPVTNRLTLQANGKQVTGTVTVSNSLGQNVLTNAATAGTLDVSALAPGVYTVSWQEGAQRVAKRFIKQAN